MSRNYSLSAQKRDRAGKGMARAVRRNEQVPAVIYGDNKEPQIIALPMKDMTLTFQKGVMKTHLCDLTVDGVKHLVLARDVQVHPVNDRVMHVDFLRVTPKTTIEIAIPVHFTDIDNCPGIKTDKGVLNVINHAIELICQATSIPESIEAPLTNLKIGDAVKLSDIKLPAGVKVPKGSEDDALATIVAPTVYVETAAPVAAVADAAAAAGAAAPAAAGGKAPAAAAGAKAPAAGGKAPAAAAAKAPAAPAKKK